MVTVILRSESKNTFTRSKAGSAGAGSPRSFEFTRKDTAISDMFDEVLLVNFIRLNIT